MMKTTLLAMLLAITAGAACAADTAPAPGAAASGMGPQQLVENSAKRMLVELDANRPMYAKDPAKLDALVANVLLPNFDTEYAARLVLGQTWRTATAEQRKRFVDAFYHSLLHNYGAALVDFTADRFNILPYRGDPADTLATVRTEVKRSNGEKFRWISACAKSTECGRPGMSSSKAFPTSRVSAPISALRSSKKAWMK